MSQELTLLVLRLWEAWGHLPFGGGFSHLQNNSGDLSQIIQEELKQDPG